MENDNHSNGDGEGEPVIFIKQEITEEGEVQIVSENGHVHLVNGQPIKEEVDNETEPHILIKQEDDSEWDSEPHIQIKEEIDVGVEQEAGVEVYVEPTIQIKLEDIQPEESQEQACSPSVEENNGEMQAPQIQGFAPQQVLEPEQVRAPSVEEYDRKIQALQMQYVAPPLHMHPLQMQAVAAQQALDLEQVRGSFFEGYNRIVEALLIPAQEIAPQEVLDHPEQTRAPSVEEQVQQPVNAESNAPTWIPVDFTTHQPPVESPVSSLNAQLLGIEDAAPPSSPLLVEEQVQKQLVEEPTVLEQPPTIETETPVEATEEVQQAEDGQLLEEQQEPAVPIPEAPIVAPIKRLYLDQQPVRENDWKGMLVSNGEECEDMRPVTLDWLKKAICQVNRIDLCWDKNLPKCLQPERKGRKRQWEGTTSEDFKEFLRAECPKLRTVSMLCSSTTSCVEPLVNLFNVPGVSVQVSMGHSQQKIEERLTFLWMIEKFTYYGEASISVLTTILANTHLAEVDLTCDAFVPMERYIIEWRRGSRIIKDWKIKYYIDDETVKRQFESMRSVIFDPYFVDHHDGTAKLKISKRLDLATDRNRVMYDLLLVENPEEESSGESSLEQ